MIKNDITYMSLLSNQDKYYQIIEAGEDDDLMWSAMTGFSNVFCCHFSQYLTEIYFLDKGKYNNVVLYKVINSIKWKIPIKEIVIDTDDLIHFINNKMYIMDMLDNEFKYVDNENHFLEMVTLEYSKMLLSMSDMEYVGYKRRLKLKHLNGTFDKVRKRED